MAKTKVARAPMKVAQIPNPGEDFQIVEREIPDPEAGQVRIKVQACGICHSDVFTAGTAPVSGAGEEISAIAGISKFLASAMTADTSNIWWLRWKRWRRYQRV
jgi:hypothetical protein